MILHVLRSAIDMSRPRSQLHFPAQGLRSEMPASNRTHVIFGELADRAADEEARRISSELGIVASLRVTCRLHVVKPDCCNRLSASRLWCLCVVSGGLGTARYLCGQEVATSLRSADKVHFEWRSN